MCALQATTIECPQCGAPIQVAERVCTYCNTAIYIRKSADVRNAVINKYIRAYQKLLQVNDGKSIEGYIALGICHLQNEIFDRAIDNFQKAIELLPEDGEAYYYAALARLKKKRPYVQTMTNIKAITSLLDTAIRTKPLGKYYYLLGLVQQDFFDKKRLRNGKSAEKLFAQAYSYEIDDEELDEIKQFTGMHKEDL